MRGLLCAALVAISLTSWVLTASTARAEEPEPSAGQALTELVVAGAPLTFQPTVIVSAAEAQPPAGPGFSLESVSTGAQDAVALTPLASPGDCACTHVRAFRGSTGGPRYRYPEPG